MPTIPTFFIPGVPQDAQEEVLARLAQLRHVPVPLLPERIFMLTWEHNSEEWTAVVGETLRGIRLRYPKSRRKPIERGLPVSDSAVVLAILPGEPFFIETDGGRSQGVATRWSNPILARDIKASEHFSPFNPRSQ
jgi:hypothetical protein